MSKQNTNDEKILQLKVQIKEKKGKLKGKKRFTPVTNCSIEIDGIRLNLQVLNKEYLIHLLVKLNSYLLSAVDLGLEDEYNFSGYSIDQWITDIKLKLDILKYEEEDRKLKDLERKLENMLSSEKKVALAIDEIESMIK